MPKKLYVNANSGTIYIGDSGLNDASVEAYPYSYLGNLTFHSKMPYVYRTQLISLGSVYFGPVNRQYVSWGSSCGVC